LAAFLWLLRRCRLNLDRNAFRKLNLMEIRYSKEAWYFSRPGLANPKGSAFDNQRYDGIYRLSFHFLSYFTVEIKRPIKYGWIFVRARFYARIPRFHTTFLLYPSVGLLFYSILRTQTQILSNSRHHDMCVVNHLVIKGSELLWFQ